METLLARTLPFASIEGSRRQQSVPILALKRDEPSPTIPPLLLISYFVVRNIILFQRTPKQFSSPDESPPLSPNPPFGEAFFPAGLSLPLVHSFVLRENAPLFLPPPCVLYIFVASVSEDGTFHVRQYFPPSWMWKFFPPYEARD